MNSQSTVCSHAHCFSTIWPLSKDEAKKEKGTKKEKKKRRKTTWEVKSFTERIVRLYLSLSRLLDGRLYGLLSCFLFSFSSAVSFGMKWVFVYIYLCVCVCLYERFRNRERERKKEAKVFETSRFRRYILGKLVKSLYVHIDW